MSTQGSSGNLEKIVPLKGSNFPQRAIAIPSQELN